LAIRWKHTNDRFGSQLTRFSSFCEGDRPLNGDIAHPVPHFSISPPL
jgi:hypothetical protein